MGLTRKTATRVPTTTALTKASAVMASVVSRPCQSASRFSVRTLIMARGRSGVAVGLGALHRPDLGRCRGLTGDHRADRGLPELGPAAVGLDLRQPGVHELL